MSEPGCGKIPRSEIPGGAWTVHRIPAGSRGTDIGTVIAEALNDELRRHRDEDDQ